MGLVNANMLNNLFKKKKYITVSSTAMENAAEPTNNASSKAEEELEQKPNIPSGRWVKCNEWPNLI